MYIRRTCENGIMTVSDSFPCIVVHGPRQVGKSTNIEYLFGEKYRKVTLDDLEDRTMAEANPRLFLDTFGWPLIIDEIQKAPKLLDEIKERLMNSVLFGVNYPDLKKSELVKTSSVD